MLVKKYIAYLGIEEPSTTTQVKVEIAGLSHAVRVAKERIASLEQALAIAEFQKEESNVKNNKPQSQEESGVSTTGSEIEKRSEGTGAVS
jgi:hypothetical protein